MPSLRGLKVLHFLFLAILGSHLFDILSTRSLYFHLLVRAQLTTTRISYIFLILLLCFLFTLLHFLKVTLLWYCSLFCSIRYYRSDTCLVYPIFAFCAHAHVLKLLLSLLLGFQLPSSGLYYLLYMNQDN